MLMLKTENDVEYSVNDKWQITYKGYKIPSDNWLFRGLIQKNKDGSNYSYIKAEEVYKLSGLELKNEYGRAKYYLVDLCFGQSRESNVGIVEIKELERERKDYKHITEENDKIIQNKDGTLKLTTIKMGDGMERLYNCEEALMKINIDKKSKMAIASVMREFVATAFSVEGIHSKEYCYENIFVTGAVGIINGWEKKSIKKEIER